MGRVVPLHIHAHAITIPTMTEMGTPWCYKYSLSRKLPILRCHYYRQWTLHVLPQPKRRPVLQCPLPLHRLELRSQVFQRLRAQLTLIDQVFGQQSHDLNLLFRREGRDSRLDHTSRACAIDGDEALVVHESEEPHDELAIHAISHTAVSGNRIAKVLNVEGTLQT